MDEWLRKYCKLKEFSPFVQFDRRFYLIAAGSAGPVQDAEFTKSEIRKVTKHAKFSKKWYVSSLESLEALLTECDLEGNVTRAMKKRNELVKERAIFLPPTNPSIVDGLVLSAIETNI